MRRLVLASLVSRQRCSHWAARRLQLGVGIVTDTEEGTVATLLAPTTATPRSTDHGLPTAASIDRECGVGVVGAGGPGAGAAGAAGSSTIDSSSVPPRVGTGGA